MSTLVVQIAAPSHGQFAPGSWDDTVSRITPVRVLDEHSPGGTSSRDGICTSAVIADDGASVTLTFDVVGTPPEIVEGLFVACSVVSVTP